MARLSQIRVYPSRDASSEGLVPRQLNFRASTHHVTEIFVRLLDKYTLDGASVVTINCGPQGTEPEFLNVLGCTGVFEEAFDFDSYLAMSKVERQEEILRLVERQLLDLAQRNGADPDPIRRCAAEVRRNSFSLEEERPKLTRSLPGRCGRIRVYRQLGTDFGERWVARLLDHAGHLAHEIEMRSCALDLRRYFLRSELRDDEFLVEDAFNKRTFSLPRLSTLLASSSALPEPFRLIP